MCLCAHLSPNLHPPGDLNVVHSGPCRQLHEFLLWQLLSRSLFKVVRSISLTDFYQLVLVCLCHFRHLPSFGLVNVWDKVNKVVLSFAFSCFGSCFNAHGSSNEHCPFAMQRMQSPLSELFLAFSFPFPFAFPLPEAPIGNLSSSRFLTLKLESLIFFSRYLWAINFHLH